MVDMTLKGRRVSTPSVGEQQIHAKLTDARVLKIFKMHATGRYRHHQLAAKFNVSRALISAVLRREVWKHIRPPKTVRVG